MVRRCLSNKGNFIVRFENSESVFWSKPDSKARFGSQVSHGTSTHPRLHNTTVLAPDTGVAVSGMFPNGCQCLDLAMKDTGVLEANNIGEK
jgi:hypothetical protein